MQLFHRRYGNPGDPPLVILHGLFGMSDNWDTLARRLAAEGLDVVVPDQRNHGRSGHHHIHSYMAMADDLLEMLDELSLNKVTLLGHSMGGKTAMQFSLEQHDRVSKLIVADISPDSGSHNQHSGLIDIMLGIPLDTLRSRQEVENLLKEKISSERIRLFLLKNIYWKDKTHLGWRVNLEIIRDKLHEVFRTIDHPFSFMHPTLFLKGELSNYITDGDIPRIMELFPRARIETIKQGSHWLHADNPDDFFNAVLKFMVEG